MQIELKVDPASIEKQVTEAIVASSFGKQLTDAIEAAIKSLGSTYSWDNQLKKWVEAEMRKIVENTIESQYRAGIEAMLREKLTPQLLDDACAAVVCEGLRHVKIGKDY